MNLGGCYINGEGVKADYVEAFKWVTLAGNQGRTEAQDWLVDIKSHMAPKQLENGRSLVSSFKARKEMEEGASRRPESSVAPLSSVEEILTKAQQGDAAAQCDLGLRYCNGDGMARDYAEALKWLQKAADQGYTMAEYNASSRDLLGIFHWAG